MRHRCRIGAALGICSVMFALGGLWFFPWRSVDRQDEQAASRAPQVPAVVRERQEVRALDRREVPVSQPVTSTHQAGSAAADEGDRLAATHGDSSKDGQHRVPANGDENPDKQRRSASKRVALAASTGNPKAPTSGPRTDRRMATWTPARQAAYRVALQTVGGAAIGYLNSSSAHLDRAIVAAPSVSPVRPLAHLKGDLGEAFAARIVVEKFFAETGGWRPITPARTGTTGIDGLFVKLRPDGLVRDVLVVEAKFGGARLQATASGRQLSEEWVRTRLQDTATRYGQIARRIRAKGVMLESNQPGSGQIFRVPLEDGGEALVWEGADGRVHASRQHAVRPVENLSQRIARQLDRIEAHLRAVAEGRISYRARLCHLGHEGNAWSIRIVDPVGKVPATELKGEFHQLPRNVRRALLDSLREWFRSQGNPHIEAERRARHVCENPAAFDRALRRPRGPWAYGLDWKTLGIGSAFGGVFGGGVELARQWIAGESADWRRIGAEAAFNAAGGAAAAYAATQAAYWTDYLLARSVRWNLSRTGGAPGAVWGRRALTRVAGVMAGGVVMALIVPTLEYAFGYVDETTWRQSVVAGVGGTAVSGVAGAAAVWLVSTYGVASTGTAIATLSGAAATNATMAWFGGGSLAAGGFGMAGGAVVLSGGFVVVWAATTYGIIKMFEWLDDRAQHRIMTARIRTLKKWAQEAYEDAIRGKATSRAGGQRTPAVLGAVP